MPIATLRKCPFHDCHMRIYGTGFACRKHWLSLNMAEKRKIHDAHVRWQSVELSIDELRDIQQQVLGTRGTA